MLNSADRQQAIRDRTIDVGFGYWWADDIHTGLRSEQSEGQCLLMIYDYR